MMFLSSSIRASSTWSRPAVSRNTRSLPCLSPAQMIVKIVDEELTALMGGQDAKLTISSKPPTVIMMVGLQGAGKTTNSAKLAGSRWAPQRL